MPVAVISCGRSGTNMTLEILAGHTYFVPSVPEEDKQLCIRNIIYADNYLTKCDTVYMNQKQLENTLSLNKRMRVIWTIRNPRDMAISKIYRGQPRSEGGDCKILSDDATFDGCIEDIDKMFNLYKFVVTNFRKKVLLVKMEDIINDVASETKRMCNFIGISYQENMINFTDRMRNQSKSSRYSNIDKNEIDKYKNWKTVYDGFFEKKNYDMDLFFKRLEVYIKYFNYV